MCGCPSSFCSLHSTSAQPKPTNICETIQTPLQDPKATKTKLSDSAETTPTKIQQCAVAPKPTLPTAAKTEQEKPVPPDSTEKPVESPSQPMAWKEDLLDATKLSGAAETTPTQDSIDALDEKINSRLGDITTIHEQLHLLKKHNDDSLTYLNGLTDKHKEKLENLTSMIFDTTNRLDRIQVHISKTL